MTELDKDLGCWPLAREVISSFYNDHQEDVRWVGKPWRRLELLIIRSFYKGECVDTTWTASVTLGLRRLGWHFHCALTRQVAQDYSEERQ